MTPLFSICIPAHNASAFIRSCVKSVASQSFKDWEVVVVDDASDDNTYMEIADLAEHSEGKIRIKRFASNQGAFLARRATFKMAAGEYVICLDSDDELIGDDVLETLASVVKNASADVVFFNGTTDLAKSVLFADYEGAGLKDGHLGKSQVLQTFLSSYVLNNICFRVIRRSLLPTTPDNVGLVMNEDRYEMASVYLRANEFYLIDKPFYYYRMNQSSTTHSAFRLEYCRQQSFIEEQIHSLYGNVGLDLAPEMTRFLLTWYSDMKQLAYGRSISQIIVAYESLAADSFFKQCIDSGAARYLPGTASFAIRSLARGKFFRSAIYVRLVNLLRRN